MLTYRPHNRAHIRARFSAAAGVSLPPGRRCVLPAVLVAAALSLALTATALAGSLFSPLSGDELALSAVYEGDGLVTVTAENLSEKPLHLQGALRLTRWASGEEVAPQRDRACFSGADIAPHSLETFSIDLSAAYDVAALEEPIWDWYALILTNHSFLFGQDWMCSLRFSEPVREERPAPAPLTADGVALEEMEASLRPYFARDLRDTALREEETEAYAARVRDLLAAVPGGTAEPLAPCLLPPEIGENTVFDPGYTLGPQRELTGLHETGVDAAFHLLGREEDRFLALSVLLPLRDYGEDTCRPLPVRWYVTYDASDVREERYAFLYGRLISFADLAPCRVYEGEGLVCYEISSLVYRDLDTYLDACLAADPDVRWDDALRARARAVYDWGGGPFDAMERRG